ncbi:VOC family protein [Pseudodesulfovibrio sp. zrk46]|uniref:VOC family protein n=1 Tax=Pseudodesulfovibrio sp. zrk46 TaxID=2725288 RepID=UPI0014499627|nr:VOC family protein [Pseudodesulfovibrio sp. zrk46]QJB58275.1 glyoxalase [Pseudodesulfovibrio sp. zrk46]
MPLKFEGPAILVEDIQRSRTFYEKLLEQEVLADFGENIPFKSGFSIWKAGHATEIIFQGKQTTPAKLANGNFEMYFETEELEACWKRIETEWDDIIHPIHEAPWLQRGFRLRDPDGHVVEVSESLPALFKRLLGEGMTAEEVAAKTGVPIEMVKGMVQGK